MYSTSYNFIKIFDNTIEKSMLYLQKTCLNAFIVCGIESYIYNKIAF